MQLVFSRAPKLAKKVRVNIGFPVVRTDGHTVGRSRDYQIFLGWVDLFTHGAPLARFARGAPL